MVKIFAKFTLPNLFEERAVGGANDPRVGVQHLLRTESLKFAVFEHSQDFHLCERTHIGDLVEKERTLVCQLEFPFDRLLRAGERAALVSEELDAASLGDQRVTNDRNGVAVDARGTGRPSIRSFRQRKSEFRE